MEDSQCTSHKVRPSSSSLAVCSVAEPETSGLYSNKYSIQKFEKKKRVQGFYAHSRMELISFQVAFMFVCFTQQTGSEVSSKLRLMNCSQFSEGNGGVEAVLVSYSDTLSHRAS